MNRIKLSCTHDAWYELLIAMNKDSTFVRVGKQELDEVLDCHKGCGFKPPIGMITADGRQYYEVRRSLLFQMVNEHGRVCPDD